MHRVYIALGSNLHEPLVQVTSAINALKNLRHSQWVATSSLYRTKPLGSQDQPDYLNAIIAIDTALAPETLLDLTQAIEQKQGRVRKTAERWGPRTLDLDILLWGSLQLDSERLTLPHYGLKDREFVLYPLAEIAPDLIFPDGEKLSECLKRIPKNGLTLW